MADKKKIDSEGLLYMVFATGDVGKPLGLGKRSSQSMHEIPRRFYFTWLHVIALEAMVFNIDYLNTLRLAAVMKHVMNLHIVTSRVSVHIFRAQTAYYHIFELRQPFSLFSHGPNIDSIDSTHPPPPRAPPTTPAPPASNPALPPHLPPI